MTLAALRDASAACVANAAHELQLPEVVVRETFDARLERLTALEQELWRATDALRALVGPDGWTDEMQRLLLAGVRAFDDMQRTQIRTREGLHASRWFFFGCAIAGGLAGARRQNP